MHVPNRLLGLALLALGLTACGHESAEQRLLGTWVFATDALDRVEGLDADQRQQMVEKAAEGYSVSIEFRSGGTLSLLEHRPGKERAPEPATWRVVSEEGDRAVLEVTPEKDDPQRATVRFEDDLMILAPENGPSMPFRRK